MKPVRFGRVPKREKAKILAAMQSVNARSQERALTAELEDEARLVATVIKAHEQTCDYTQEKVQPLLQRALEDPVYTQCPTQLACPLNPNPQPLQNGILEDFSERFSPAIRGVVEFAKRIPGFSLLSQDDQVTLLKAGVFEVLLVRLACMFNTQTNTMLCLNGQVLKRESLHSTSNARFLMDSMFDFAERLNQLRLRDSDLGLFCAVVIIAADRPGLRNTELVEKMQSKLMQALQSAIMQSHPDIPNMFQELIKKIPDLRTLNTLHSEKLLAFKMEPRNPDTAALSALSVSALNNYMAAPAWGIDGYSVAHPQSHQRATPSEDSKGSWSERELVVRSPGQRSSAGSEWSLPEAKETDVDTPTPSFTTDGRGGEKSPAGSKSGDSESVCSSEVALITELTGSNGTKRRHADNSEACASSGDEGSVSDGQLGVGGGRQCPFKLRKLESPCDSGIESGKEAGSTNGTQSAGTSVCGSPRSLVEEKVKEVEDSTIDDMPVLKRALQAPPLVNTNLLMDEAYKPHKKFRALRKEPSSNELPIPTSPESGSQRQQNSSSLTSLGSVLGASLASSHSMLVRTLEQGPRLTEQQLKHTDIIHNYIMGTTDTNSSSSPLPPSRSEPSDTSMANRMLYNVSQTMLANHQPPPPPPPPPPPQQQQQQHHHQQQQQQHAQSFVASSTAGQTNTGHSKGVVLCPPGYFIPQQSQSPAYAWPFANSAAQGIQVRPAATFVPNVQPTNSQQQPTRHSPQPPAGTPTSLSLSPQPTGGASSPQLPRMYYDPRSTTPTSTAVAPAAAPQASSYMNYGSMASKCVAPKPTSPLAGQVVEMQVGVGSSENQPLNLSKKVVMAHLHKVKMETM